MEQRVLIVDDERRKRVALASALESLRVKIDEAASATEALRLLLSRAYAVILLDVRMPEVDGFELARLIRDRPATATTPIIFVTAIDGIDPLDGYGLGAVDFMTAPIDPAVLRTKVSVFLELGRLVAREQALSASKSQFLNLAAHELRTPLGVAAGYLSLLLDGSLGTPPEQWEEPLRIISMKIGELRQISDELIDTARVENHQVVPSPRPLDLRDVTRAAVNRARPRARLLKGQIEVFAPLEAVPCSADPKLLGRVLDNLIQNALNYGGDPPLVTVSVTPETVVRVADRGPGIPGPDRDRIFDEFYRSRVADNLYQEGTGLGLYLSRELAQAMGGHVWLEESTPEGSVFAVRMPSLAHTTERSDDSVPSERGHVPSSDGGDAAGPSACAS